MTAIKDVKIDAEISNSDSSYFLSDEEGNEKMKRFKRGTVGSKCKNMTAASLYLILLCGWFFICGYFIVNRNRFYRIDTMDSWGNKCGRPNVAIDGVPQSGRNMTDQKYTFFFSTISLKKVMLPQKRSDQHYLRLCVKKCPDEAITCSQLVQDNGYSSIQATIDKYKSCEAYQNTILPYYTGDYSCKPKIIHTLNGEDQTFESDFSKGFHSATIGATSNFDRVYYNFFKILVLILAALTIAYTSIFLVRRFPYFSMYYFYFIGIHAALMSSIICWTRVYKIDQGENPDSKNVEETLKKHQKLPVSTYGGSGNYLVTTTHYMDEIYSISSLVNRAAYITVGVVTMLIFFWLASTAFEDLRKVRIKMICLMIRLLNHMIDRAPMLGLLPLICIWPHMCFYNFWTILTYFLYLPKRLWRDEESGIVVLDAELPHWETLVLSVMSYLIWWVAGTAHGVQRFFTIGCMCELYFSEKGLRSEHNRSPISYGRWVRRTYYMFGQICAFSFINTYKQIISNFFYYLGLLGLNLKKPCTSCCDCSLVSCCCKCWCGTDYMMMFQMDPRCLVSVAVFGDSFYVSVRRTNQLLDRRGKAYRSSLRLFSTMFYMIRFGTASVVLLIALIVELPPISFGEYHSLTIPYLMSFMMSSTIAKIVMNTYLAMVDAIYLCYCIDLEVNNGKDLPFYAPPEYQEVVSMMEDLQKEREKADDEFYHPWAFLKSKKREEKEKEQKSAKDSNIPKK